MVSMENIKVGDTVQGCDRFDGHFISPAEVVEVSEEYVIVLYKGWHYELTKWSVTEVRGEWIADCGCAIRPFPEGRGDSADTIVEHRDDCPDGGDL
jgi:hypothetical protein